MTIVSESRQVTRGKGLEALPWRQLLGATLVLVLAMLGAFAPRLFSQASLAAFIERGACAEIHAQCRVRGAIRAHLFPYPAIEARDVTVALPGGGAEIHAAEAYAQLRVLALLTGRFSLNHLDLEGARIDIVAPPGGMRLLASANDAGAALLGSVAAADVVGNRLTRLGLDHSRLVIHSSSRNRAVAVEGLSGLVTLPQRGGELFADFQGLVDGELARLHVAGPSLPELTRSEGSPIKVDALLGQNWLSYRGRLVKAPDLVAAGTLEASCPSLKQALGRLRGHWPAFLPDLDVHVAGQSFITSQGANFENTEFTIGRSHFTGGLSLRMTADGRPAFSGTIAAPLIELAEPFSFRPEEITLSTFGRLPDIDLRLSVRRAKIGAVRLDEIAAGLILADQRLDMTVSQGLEGEAGAKLHIVAAPEPGGVAVRAQASSESVDFGPLLSGFSPHLTGTGSISLSLEGRGGNLDALTHALSGKASLQIHKGVVSLPDARAEPLASAGNANPNPVSPAPQPHRFSEANFTGTVEHGIWTLSQGWIGEGPSQIAVDGSVDVADRDIDLSFSASGETHSDPPWRLRAAGPWAGPSVWRQAPAAK